MASDPMKQLCDLLEGSQTGSQESQTRPHESLPRIISGPRESSGETDRRGWADFKTVCYGIAMLPWQFLSQWLDSWFRVVLTGSAVGVGLGLVYRWILLPS